MAAAALPQPEVKLFNRWSFEDVEIIHMRAPPRSRERGLKIVTKPIF